jgi:hypothetical protein
MSNNSFKNQFRPATHGLNLHSIMQAMPDMIIIMHRNGQIPDIYGPKPEKLLAPANELIGCTLQKLFTKEETQRHLDFYEHCIENNETGVLQYELPPQWETKLF